MAVRQSHLKLLKPYLMGDEPYRRNKDDDLEWDMVCPLHEDSKRSASLNLGTGEYTCFAGCDAYSVAQLVRRQAEWIPPGAAASNGGIRRHVEQPEEVSEARIQGWQAALEANDLAMEYLCEFRNLTEDTIHKYQIGWHIDKRTYTIPVRNQDGQILNIRFYKPNASQGGTKIWNMPGMVTAALYPMQILAENPERVVICGGEWDALVTNQNGFPCLTRTASETTWRAEWNQYFEGKIVYVAHDCDHTGVAANRKVARQLLPVAQEVRLLELPYPITPKHGKDLGDFWSEHDGAAFEQLLRNSRPARKARDHDEPEDVSVLHSFDAGRVGKPSRMHVTVKGKRGPGYSVPKQAVLTCTQDAGAKCNYCSMQSAASGEAKYEIKPSDPVVLELIEATSNQVNEAIRKAYGAQKCSRLVIEPAGHQAVETLFARPSLDHHADSLAGSYMNTKIMSVGRHDTLPNNTFEVVGALHPNPQTQANEFLAWHVRQIETSVDRFDIDEKTIKLLSRFQSGKQRPLAKLASISKELSAHVTKIYGRPEMHAMMDLVFHSVLAFKFGGELISRGWLEALVLGDTRTGKSVAAERLARHYAAGEIVTGESATFAGIIGGVQQLGGGREWAVTWGLIPLNDRRMVIIDEASGLQPKDIGRMSDVRSRGIANLQKVQQDTTLARTRILWLSNPRDAGMSDYTYGVQALPDLIGNPEDIARFDLMCAVSIGDVEPGLMNRPHEVGEQRYTSDACANLVRWAWTRTADQIVWTAGAEDEVYKLALDMGGRYVEDPPLVQVANIRVKIARTACALAARLFSCDPSGERLLVRPEHVRDAVEFMDRLYRMPSLGYAERSAEAIKDRQAAERNFDATRTYLQARPGLAKFLRGAGHFRRQDLEEILNVDRDMANAIITSLYEARMVRKQQANVKVEPTLHKLLREVKFD